MLQLASFQGVLRLILILLLVYYGMKLLSRLLAPYLVKYLSRKAEKRFGDQFGGFRNEPPKQGKVGETVIDKIPNDKKAADKDVGEYVDYEEID